MSRILLLEDDEALGRGICMALETPNCTVTHCSTRLQAIKILQGVVFDLLILDINLPDGSGLELLRTLRQNGTSTPAILLTANDLELDEVTGLEAGADDYITKPFSIAVLKLRLKKLVEREEKQPKKDSRVKSGNLCMDTDFMKIWVGKEEIECSMTEYKLLKYFLENRGQVLTQNQILEAVWDCRGRYVNANTLQVNIGRLRKKLEGAGCTSSVKTIHGIGYLWEEEG